jgi:hypothetical protein
MLKIISGQAVGTGKLQGTPLSSLGALRQPELASQGHLRPPSLLSAHSIYTTQKFEVYHVLVRLVTHERNVLNVELEKKKKSFASSNKIQKWTSQKLKRKKEREREKWGRQGRLHEKISTLQSAMLSKYLLNSYVN